MCELAVAMDDVELVHPQPHRLQLQRIERRRDAGCNATVTAFKGRQTGMVADAW